MKTFFVGLCIAAGALIAPAQIPAPPGQPPGAPAMPSRLDFLTDSLSLTSSQQVQARTIFNSEDMAAGSALTAWQQAQAALTTAAKQGQSDSAMDQLAAAVGAAFGGAAAIHAKAEKQFYAILTADQQARYDNLTTMGFNMRNHR